LISCEKISLQTIIKLFKKIFSKNIYFFIAYIRAKLDQKKISIKIKNKKYVFQKYIK